MKKFYLSALAIGSIFCGFAQKVSQSQIIAKKNFATEVPASKESNYVPKGATAVWSNDFSTPGDWTIDNDGMTGSGFGWDIGTTEQSWLLNQVINSTSDGNFAEVNNGVASPAPGTQQVGVTYTLTTAAPIDVNGLAGGSNNYILEFLQYGARFYEAQEVYISTDGTTWTLAGSNADIEMYTASSGDIYANPTLKTINLSGVLPGGTNSLWIRFSWTSEFPSSTNVNAWVAYGWMIDDVAIKVAQPDEFKLHAVYTHDIFNAWDYYQTPQDQAIPSTIGLYVSNEGGAVQTKTIDVNFDLGGSSAYQGTTPDITLQPGESDTIWFNTGFTASEIGTYTINAALPADADDLNNNATESFEVTDFIYGHNHALGTSNLRFSNEEEIGIGNIYEINQNQLLKGIDVAFAGGTGGTTAGTYIDVFVYEMVNGSIQDVDNIDVVNFAYQIPTPAPTTGITTIQLPSPVTLEAGKLYFAILKMSQTSADKLSIKASSKGDQDNSTVCYGPFGEGDAVNYFVGWGTAPAVKLNFNPVVGINETSGNVAISEVYPNPTSGETTINYSIINAENVKVMVVDVTGKVVKTVVNGLQLAGDHSVSFDAADLANGSYYVNIVTEASTVTQKFIKK